MQNVNLTRCTSRLRCVLAVTLLSAMQAGAQETVRLEGHVLDTLPQAVHLARTPQTVQEPLTLTVMLNWSDPAGFDSFRRSFEDPTSISYRKHLSPQEFNNRFGPTQQAYDAVLAWLTQNGFSLEVGSDNRLTLTVSGTRGQAEHAFGVTIDDYLMGARQFHAIATDPVIPATIAPWIRSVTGFSNLAQPRPALTPQTIAQAYNGVLTPAGALPGTGPGLLPPGINGAGQTVALIEYDSFFPSDVSYWLAQVGLPAALINQVTTVPVNKGTAPSGCSITVANCGEAEVLLDIDTVLGIAQGANIAVLVTSKNTDQLTMVNAAANYLNRGPGGGGVISDSWTECEPEISTSEANSMETLLQSLSVVGETFFVATGDTAATCVSPQGRWANTASYPGIAPHAVAVGGTSLQPSAVGNYGTESWWTGGSFGVSKLFGRPSYQNAFTNAAGRSIPDVSAEAAQGIPVCQNTQCIAIGGTSLSTPIWAGIWSLASQAESLARGTVGDAEGTFGGAFYSLAPYLHSASSMTAPGNTFAQVGLGSPNITNVVSLNAGPPSISGISPATGPVTGGTTVTLTGHAFIGVSSVLFAGVPATSFTVDAESQITAVTPPCLPSSACAQSSNANGTPVTIQTPAGNARTSIAQDFKYLTVITSVSPNSGPMLGGTSVTVNGFGFGIGNSGPFFFGGVAAPAAQCASTTQCGVITPAHAVGTVHVTYAGSATSSADQFTYDGPIITSLSPNVGAQNGGTTVDLTGTGFSQTMTVKFGNAAVPVQSCVGSTSCTVFSPAGNGQEQVTVTVNGVTSAQSAGDIFTYETFPYGTMSPTTGSYLGGTVVTVTGANFSTAANGTQFTFATGFGATATATNVHCGSTTVCTMTAPAYKGGSGPYAAVSVSANGLTSPIGEFLYNGFPTPPTPKPGKPLPWPGVCQ